MKKKKKLIECNDDGAIDMTDPRNIFLTEEFSKLSREQKREIFFNREKRLDFVKKIDKDWEEQCELKEKEESS